MSCREINSGLSILLPVDIHSVNAKLVLDTGAAVTVVSSNVYNKLPQNMRPELGKVSPSLKLEVANDELLPVLGTVTLDFKIRRDNFQWQCFVAPIREDGLLGLDFLQAHNYVLSAESGLKLNKKKYPTLIEKVSMRAIRIRCDGTVTIPAFSEAIIEGEADEEIQSIYGLVSPVKDSDQCLMIGYALVDPNRRDMGIPIRVLNPSSSNVIISEGEKLAHLEEVEEIAVCGPDSKANILQSDNHNESVPEHLVELFECSSENLDQTERNQLKSLLIKHSDVFASSSSDLGRTSVVKHRIDTGDNPPAKQRPRRPPFAFADEESKIIQGQLKSKVIRESSSSWAAPLVYVRKRDGTTRPCVDYRLLNSVTKKDAYPLPNLNDCLDHLGDASWFSCLDILSAYYQIEVEEEDRPKTAFVCKQGLYEYNVTLVQPSRGSWNSLCVAYNGTYYSYIWTT